MERLLDADFDGCARAVVQFHDGDWIWGIRMSPELVRPLARSGPLKKWTKKLDDLRKTMSETEIKVRECSGVG